MTCKFDRSFGLMESGSDSTGILKVIHKLMRYQNFVPLVPGLHQILLLLAKLLKLPVPNLIINQIVGASFEFYKDYKFDEKEKETAQPFFVKALRLVQDGKADEEALFDSCSSNIVAGSDSTSAALSSAIYHIYNNPEVLGKLRAEIKEKKGTGGSLGLLSLHDTTEMPYLQAVMKEALRITPPTGIVLPREVPTGGTTLDSVYLPAKVGVKRA